MKIIKCISTAFLSLVIFYFLLNCSRVIIMKPEAGKQFYLAHNIWYETENWLRSKNTGHFITLPVINYKTGKIIRIGTKVEDVKVYGNIIIFFVPSINKTITFKINRNFQGDLNGTQLFERTITIKTFEELTQGLGPSLINSIKAGIVTKGMSKEAVILAFGYPPLHKTPNLNHSSWFYWRNKLGMFEVRYDENDKVVEDIIP